MADDRRAILAGFVLPLAWDVAQAAYVDAVGAVVPEAIIRQVLEAVIADSAVRLAILTERFQGGAVAGFDWQMAVFAELRVGHGLAAALAHGGVDHLDAGTWGYVESQLRRQADFLTRFAGAVAQGQAGSVAQQAARAQLYAGAFHSTFEGVRLRDAAFLGHSEVRNVLAGGAEHCDDCAAATAQGWVAVGLLSLPGSRQCVSNCRCVLQTRVADPAAVAGEAG